jgi:excisionase family DNA binding protein
MRPRDSSRMPNVAPAAGSDATAPCALLTVSDVAGWLKLKPATVRALTRRGEISFHRVGRAIRFRPGDVEVYLARQRRPARGERALTASRLQ